MKFIRIVAVLAALFACPLAQAQTSGKVTQHAFVIGKGTGVTGYTSLLCTSAQLAVGQAAADPICQTITGDVTISAGGVTAIGSAKVHSSMLNADVFSTAHSWSATQSFPNNSLTLAELPAFSAPGVMGATGAGNTAQLTQAQLTALINPFTTTLNGAVPNPGTATGKVLSDNGTWVAVGGTGTVTEQKNTAGNGLSISGNCDNTTSNAASPCQYAISTITGPGVLGASGSGAGQAVATVKAPILLETLTPSGASSFASSASWAGYSSIKLVVNNLTFSTSLNLIAQLHSGGAYQGTGYSGGVTYTQTNSGSAGAFGTTTSNLTTGIYIVTSGLSSSSFQVGGELQLLNITGSQYKQVTGKMTANNATTAYVFWAGAAWTGSGTVDGIQFTTSTGTVSGSIEIWGIP